MAGRRPGERAQVRAFLSLQLRRTFRIILVTQVTKELSFWDDDSGGFFIQMPQSKPSESKTVGFFAGREPYLCFFTNYGDYLGMHGLPALERRVLRGPCEAQKSVGEVSLCERSQCGS